MVYEDFEHIKVEVRRHVAWITIDYPPINLMDPTLRGEFNALIPKLAEDAAANVIVFQSANPEFFCALMRLQANRTSRVTSTTTSWSYGPVLRPTTLSSWKRGRPRGSVIQVTW